MDSSVPLTHPDPSDLGLIFLIKKHKIRFRILSDLGIQSWIFLKKRTRSLIERLAEIQNTWLKDLPISFL